MKARELPPPAPLSQKSAADYLPLLVFLVILLLPLCFLGYGSDNDTYSELDKGRALWLHHILITSRNPGYWTFEAIVFFLNRLGGYLLTNLVTLTMSGLVIWRFLVIATRLRLPYPGIFTACLVATPVYAIASTSTVDYVWSLLGIVFLMEMLAEDRWSLAACAGTFAYLIRGTNCIVIAGILGGGMIAEWMGHRAFTARAWKIFLTGVVVAVIGSLPLIASYRWAGNSMGFLAPETGNPALWGMKMRVGRFLYKGWMLYGGLAWLVLAASVISRWKEKGSLQSVNTGEFSRRMNPLLVGGLIATVLLFFRFPVEVSYLIPGSVFSLLLLGESAFMRSRFVAVAFLVAVISANFVTIQLARPNFKRRATGATLHPGLVNGQLLSDVSERLKLKHCTTVECWGRTEGPPRNESRSEKPFSVDVLGMIN